MASEITEKMSEVAVLKTEENAGDGDDDVVDPWNVVSKSETGIDYDKLISEYSLICLKFYR